MLVTPPPKHPPPLRRSIKSTWCTLKFTRDFSNEILADDLKNFVKTSAWHEGIHVPAKDGWLRQSQQHRRYLVHLPAGNSGYYRG